MPIELPNLENVVERDGCVINVGKKIVLLEVQTAAEIRRHFVDFSQKLDRLLKRLLCAPYGDVVAKYGWMNLNENKIADRSSIPYGALTRSGSKLVHLQDGAVARGLAYVGVLPKFSTRGAPTTRLPKGSGKAADLLAAQSDELQCAVIEALIDDGDMDSYFHFDQRCLAGIAELGDSIEALDDAQVGDFLEEIANRVEQFITEPITLKGTLGGKGTGHLFGRLWFAQYLASRHVWLFPMEFLPSVRNYVPRRLLPIVAWLSVPDNRIDIADEVLAISKFKKEMLVLNVFVTMSLISNAWASNEFRSGPLVELKHWIHHNESPRHRSAATNKLFFLLRRLLGADQKQTSDFAIFAGAPRLVSMEGGSFRWCANPTPRNTRFVSRLIQREVTGVPDQVKIWARQLDQLLPAFQVKYQKRNIYFLNGWLAFLLTLREDDIPNSFADIDLHRHGVPFITFISSRTGTYKVDMAKAAVSKMKHLWNTVANDAGYLYKVVNPFDIPITSKKEWSEPDPSGREAIAEEVLPFLIRFNRRGDYAFARTDPRYFATRRNRHTGVYETVFLGLEAKVIDLVLTFGFRLVDARWLDSGEGDQNVVDPVTMAESRNPLPTAIEGRKQGFIQRFWFDDPENPRYELGMYRVNDKSGVPKFHPFSDDHIVKMVSDLIVLQNTYNSMSGPVRFLDVKALHESTDLELFADGFPLFRRTDEKYFAAVTEDRVRGYWARFCEWVQPLLDEELGFHYPLFVEDRVRFHLHDSRVTAVTHHLDGGTPLLTTMKIMGHANPNTTLHYYASKKSAVHKAVNDRRAKQEKWLESSKEERLKQAVDHGYIPDHVENHVGLQQTKKLLSAGHLSAAIEFSWGVCPGGDCNKGGPIVANKPTPVWRPMACSRCRYRVGGPKYAEGMAKRVNVLLADLYFSSEREREMNEEIEKLEYKGVIREDLRQIIKAERLVRKNLELDIKAEIEAHQGILKLEQSLRKLGMGKDVLVPMSEAFPAEQTSFTLREAHPYQLFHDILSDPLLPSASIEVPSEIRLRFNDITRKMLRNVGLETLGYYGPSPSENDALLMAFGDTVVDVCSTPEIRQLADDVFDGNAFPNLLTVLQRFQANLPQLEA